MNLVQLLTLINTLGPGFVALIQDVKGLFEKYPALTPDQLSQFIQQYGAEIHTTNLETLALIAQDQAKPAQ